MWFQDSRSFRISLRIVQRRRHRVEDPIAVQSSEHTQNCPNTARLPKYRGRWLPGHFHSLPPRFNYVAYSRRVALGKPADATASKLTPPHPALSSHSSSCTPPAATFLIFSPHPPLCPRPTLTRPPSFKRLNNPILQMDDHADMSIK